MFSHISSHPVNPPLGEAWREYDMGVKTQEGESLTLLHYESFGTGLCMTQIWYYLKVLLTDKLKETNQQLSTTQPMYNTSRV